MAKPIQKCSGNNEIKRCVNVNKIQKCTEIIPTCIRGNCEPIVKCLYHESELGDYIENLRTFSVPMCLESGALNGLRGVGKAYHYDYNPSGVFPWGYCTAYIFMRDASPMINDPARPGFYLPRIVQCPNTGGTYEIATGPATKEDIIIYGNRCGSSEISWGFQQNGRHPITGEPTNAVVGTSSAKQICIFSTGLFGTLGYPDNPGTNPPECGPAPDICAPTYGKIAGLCCGCTHACPNCNFDINCFWRADDSQTPPCPIHYSLRGRCNQCAMPTSGHIAYANGGCIDYQREGNTAVFNQVDCSVLRVIGSVRYYVVLSGLTFPITTEGIANATGYGLAVYSGGGFSSTGWVMGYGGHVAEAQSNIQVPSGAILCQKRGIAFKEYHEDIEYDFIQARNECIHGVGGGYEERVIIFANDYIGGFSCG